MRMNDQDIIIIGDQRYMLGHLLPTIAWAVGKWWYTFQRQNGLVFAKGYWSTIYARDGDAWKIRMSTFNQTPAPAAPAETK